VVLPGQDQRPVQRTTPRSNTEIYAVPARLQVLPATPEALAEWWVDAPLERRREMLALVLDRIIVKPARRAGVVDADRLEFVWK
ncbi:hypothetical protein, partial [Salinispora cortesiana]|uniref:hypothetical protein n=1 Tax=Salinispora cortesiana TaxID=1305843 RepID=UPI001CB7339C